MALLERLRSAAGGFVAVEALGPDVPSVLADIGELEQFGFELERHPYLGIAYRGPARKLCPDQVEFELGILRIGRRVAVWGRVGSTNDVAAAAGGSSANEGLVVLAEEQTAGRGRRGRSWVAPPDSSLLMSILLFPPAGLAEPGWLTALGAVAAAEVVAEVAGVEARIKWPNDVRVAGRKVAGVLVERGAGVVVGLGLNVNFSSEDLPEPLRATATSLRELGGRHFDRSELARILIRRLDALYDDGLRRGPDPLRAAWLGLLEPLGGAIRLATADGPLSGILAGVDGKKGVAIALEDGSVRWFSAAEVLDQAPDGRA